MMIQVTAIGDSGEESAHIDILKQATLIVLCASDIYGSVYVRAEAEFI